MREITDRQKTRRRAAVWRYGFFTWFTLAELIVVVTVLAILATVGFVALSSYAGGAKDATVKTNVRSVYTSISAESAVSGNSPRYYIVHDAAAALSWALVAIDGTSVPLTWGAWNQAGTNYSAWNPDYVKLRLNPEKFRISFRDATNRFDDAHAAYDDRLLAVWAMDATMGGPGTKTKRTVSYYQVAWIPEISKTAFVVWNFPGETYVGISGLVKDPASPSGTGALIDGVTAGTTASNGVQQWPYDPIVSLSAYPQLPVGRLGKPYNGGVWFDFKTLLSVTGDPTYSISAATWSISWSALPAGLSLGTNGILNGTPSSLTAWAGQNINVVANYGGKDGQNAYLIKVGNAVLAVASISVWYAHTCAVEIGGKVKCWWFWDQGQLWNGTSGATNKSLTPVAVLNASDNSELTGAVEVASGYSFSCARINDGTVKCWGHGWYGQLGNNGSLASSKAVVVKLTGWTADLASATSLSLFWNTACATVSWGGAKCWGQGMNGQLWIGAKTNKLVATDVLASAGVPIGSVESVSMGYAHACAKISGGWAKCWGANANYQLWTGNNSENMYPTDVLVSAGGSTLAWISEIATGYLHTCALMTNGWVKCWGDNTQAQFGDGTLLAKYVPTDVLVSAGWPSFTWAVSIETGNYHTCVKTDSGGTKCWWRNVEWQIGDATTVQKKVPTSVLESSGWSPISNVASVSLYSLHTCASFADQTMRCWGNGTSGELWNGLVTSSNVPTEVLE